MRICSVEDCLRKYYAKDLCQAHYDSWYRTANRDSIISREAAYRESNKDKIRSQHAKYHQANRSEILERHAEYGKTHREIRNAASARRRHRVAVDMTAEDRKLSVEYRKIIAGWPCEYCGTVNAESYHVDHMLPISRGGTDAWWNLANACSDCNLRKGTKTAEEFESRVKESLK